MILHMEWEEYEELMKKEYREEGRKEGIRAMIRLCEQLGFSEDATVDRLMEGFGFSEQEAREALKKCR